MRRQQYASANLCTARELRILRPKSKFDHTNGRLNMRFFVLQRQTVTSPQGALTLTSVAGPAIGTIVT